MALDGGTDQVKDCKQQNSNKTFGECRSGWNPRKHDECDLMAAEIKAAAVCQVCGERGQSAKDYLCQANKGSEKGTIARKTKDSGKAQEPRTLTTRRKELAAIAKWLVILR